MVGCGSLIRLCLHTWEIAHIASRVELGIGVEYLFVESTFRQAETIILPYDRRKVTCDDDEVAGVLGTSEVDEHAVVVVVTVDPFEALILEVDLM